MRDDPSRKYPPNDPYRRAPAASAQGGDPLAELAKLIGQNDPFSDFARDQTPVAAPAHDPRRAAAASPDWQAQPDLYAPQARPAPQQYSQAAAPHGGYRAAPTEQQLFPETYRDAPATDPRYATQDYAQPDPAAGHEYDPQQYDDPRYAAYGDQHGYPPQNSYPPAHGQQGQGQQGYGQQSYGSDPYYRGMPHDEDMYEDHAPPRRRGGLLTVMAVLALAVVGTAAAFGYRAVFSSSGSALTPPTIKADAGPNKVVPAQSADASGKLIYDRVGDKSQPERVISREEQPVDLKNAAPPPRVILSAGMPNPVAPVASTPAFAAPSSVAASASANAATEPKKIRTLTIRADQLAAPETASPRSAPAPAPVRQAVAEDQPMPASTTVRTTTIRPQVAQSDPNAPLSLTPSSSSQRAGTMRTASAPAARAAATTSGDSAYAVQVTSQRSEAEAQSSYRALQAKYPNELGTRQANIRRADLGDKGTYYRAQVPFGSQGEASEFCASLKAAGAQCVVQRN